MNDLPLEMLNFAEFVEDAALASVHGNRIEGSREELMRLAHFVLQRATFVDARQWPTRCARWASLLAELAVAVLVDHRTTGDPPYAVKPLLQALLDARADEEVSSAAAARIELDLAMVAFASRELRDQERVAV